MLLKKKKKEVPALIWKWLSTRNKTCWKNLLTTSIYLKPTFLSDAQYHTLRVDPVWPICRSLQKICVSPFWPKLVSVRTKQHFFRNQTWSFPHFQSVLQLNTCQVSFSFCLGSAVSWPPLEPCKTEVALRKLSESLAIFLYTCFFAVTVVL